MLPAILVRGEAWPCSISIHSGEARWVRQRWRGGWRKAGKQCAQTEERGGCDQTACGKSISHPVGEDGAAKAVHSKIRERLCTENRCSFCIEGSWRKLSGNGLLGNCEWIVGNTSPIHSGLPVSRSLWIDSHKRLPGTHVVCAICRCDNIACYGFQLAVYLVCVRRVVAHGSTASLPRIGSRRRAEVLLEKARAQAISATLRRQRVFPGYVARRRK